MLKKHAISVESLVTQKQGNIISNMDGEIVMMSVNNGKYYNLGNIGGMIWSLMNNPTKVLQIVRSLQEQFTIEQEECEKQVLAFLNQMLQEGLLQVDDH
ncbi:MAG: lasso peptide biosynthesis PqqD family chaperone [Bacillus sp. (in: firmicutes)]